MRLATVALALLAATTLRAAVLHPRIDDATAVAVETRWLNRDAARTLVRFTAPPPQARVARRLDRAPHLEPVATVEPLAETLEVPPQITGRIAVDGATSVRLLVAAAPGTTLWLAGEDDAAFERFDAHGESVWTPTIAGSVVYVAAERPVTISKLAVATTAPAMNGASCLNDLACAATLAPPEVAEASRAIAMIRFVRGEASYVCTGALVNDARGSGTPYFLTARHCIATQEEADSIEAIWDERADACGVRTPSSRTRTYGAQLLAASADTDVALLRLHRIPPNRVFLGVDTSPLAGGTPVYRLSHAHGAPQTFSTGVIETSGGECASAPRSRFIYTRQTSGAVALGSSGAPLLLPGLRVAGQLLGLCGPSPDDACAIYNDAVDGAIAASWPLLAPYLDPPPGGRRRAARH